LYGSAWKIVLGKDLLGVLKGAERLDDLVEACQAIYLWRRDFSPPAHVVQSGVVMADWLEKCLSWPFAKLGPQSLAHFVQLDGITIGGGGLTDIKRETLDELLRHESWRRFIQKYLASLTQVAPPLYIGEASNLETRVRDHLHGRSQFGAAILKQGVTWDGLQLAYLRVGAPQDEPDSDEPSESKAKDRRTLLELIAARLALAGATSRPG
jgi:hypothetical protein